MVSDPLKSFGVTSETEFLLLYCLQLFLSMENDKTHCPYDGVSRESAMTLCGSPARLPTHIRDFILWQRNILKLDDGEILDTEMPRGLQKKYAVKGARLAEIEDKQQREVLIRECLEEVDSYLARFNEVRAVLEATEDRFMTVEETLLRAESLDDGVSRAMKDQKDELERMRKELTELRGDIEDICLPDTIKFEHTPDKAQNLMKHLSEVNLQAREAIRLYQLEI